MHANHESSPPAPHSRLEAWLSQPVLHRLTWEHLAYALIFVLAVLTRFYDLGARVMSHDESLHTYFSYQLAQGRGFQHTPLMHGPFLFHVTALSYFLFGADDFTSRVPMAIFGVVLVMLPLALRRWLGRWGALATAIMLLLSPSILYHARYIRQEQSILVWTLLTAIVIWRYLDAPQPRWLIALSAVLAFHATDKSTSFLVVAWLMLFLAPLALWQLSRMRNTTRDAATLVALGAITALLMVGLSIGFERVGSALAATLGVTALVSAAEPTLLNINLNTLALIGALLALTALVAAALSAFYVWGFGAWMQRAITGAPALNVIFVLVTTTMFMGSPALLLIKNRIWELFRGEELVPISLLGDMANLQSNPQVITTMLSMALALVAIAIALGVVWQPRQWAVVIAVFLLITTTLFTTVFTNTAGIGTGFVGQLGYWMAQQPVQRGNQPWYYYFLITPMYEYTVMLGSFGAGLLLAVRLLRSVRLGETIAMLHAHRFVIFTTWWTLASWAIYTIAGEKMPWLTTHLALPMSVLTGWFIGQSFKRLATALQGAPAARWGLAFGLGLLSVVLFVRLLSLIGSLDLVAFDARAASWGFQVLLTLVLLAGAWRALQRTVAHGVLAALALAGFTALSALTLRTAVMVTYINYDYVKEFLFYAHGAPGVKIALRQMEDLRDRLGGSEALRIGYTQNVSWPFSWYLVHFPGARYLGSALPPDVNTFHIVLASEQDPDFLRWSDQLSEQFVRFDYTLIWWPMQDYFNLTWERISYSLLNPQARAALWEIAFNRNFEPYAQLFNKTTLTPERWSPSHRFSLFVRRDLAEQLWDYRLADVVGVGEAPTRALRLVSPTSIAFAPDGTRYVIDHRLNRVFHQDAEGNTLRSWGGAGNAPAQFNDAWGIAVDEAGNVYVADTFNHRVQKFDPFGNLLRVWGLPGISNAPGEGNTTYFFGPRAIAFDRNGHVLVTDTGNKRVQVFDKDGNFITQFGAPGTAPGEFNEPVGIAVDEAGLIYVADVWNRRVQVFDASYRFVRAWLVPAWEQLDPETLQAVDHKPYIAVGGGRVFVSSPRTGEVLVFTPQGAPLTLPQLGFAPEDRPTGVALHRNQLYVTNAANGDVLRFELGPYPSLQ